MFPCKYSGIEFREIHWHFREYVAHFGVKKGTSAGGLKGTLETSSGPSLAACTSCTKPCHSIFKDRTIFRLIFPRNRSVPVYIIPHRKEKRLTSHQKFATSVDKMMMSVKNKVRCDWSPEVPVGPWIRRNSNLNCRDRFVKTSQQKYGVIARF